MCVYKCVCTLLLHLLTAYEFILMYFVENYVSVIQYNDLYSEYKDELCYYLINCLYLLQHIPLWEDVCQCFIRTCVYVRVCV